MSWPKKREGPVEESPKAVQFPNPFLTFRIFSLYVNADTNLETDSRLRLSLNQILDQQQLEQQIYLYDQQGKRQYVQFKLTEITLKNKKMSMIQILDISDSIMYQQEKNHTEQLSLLNATISHELRNPLNSIKARNMEKKYIHQIIKDILLKEDQDNHNLRSKIKTLVLKLQEGQKVQESSCQLMSMNVQDLLDYAQINAKKFRKNFSRFNIKDLVQNVIRMQQDKADDQNIELCC